MSRQLLNSSTSTRIRTTSRLWFWVWYLSSFIILQDLIRLQNAECTSLNSLIALNLTLPMAQQRIKGRGVRVSIIWLCKCFTICQPIMTEPCALSTLIADYGWFINQKDVSLEIEYGSGPAAHLTTVCSILLVPLSKGVTTCVLFALRVKDSLVWQGGAREGCSGKTGGGGTN